MRLAALDGKAAMCTPRQSAHARTVHLKDEIYRQMFRLEENRPGADLGLAIALLRAWIATGMGQETAVDRDWLVTLSPICLQMIEAAQTTNPAALRCAG
jgi:hypothetical protein